MKKRTGDTIKSVSSAVIAIAIRIILIIVLVPLVIKGVKWSYDFGHSIFYASSVEEAPGTDKEVTFTEGTSVKEAGEELLEKGLIDNVISFRVQALFFKYEIQPGTYTLNTSMTSRKILETLNSGPPEDEYS